jgi:lipopolysaccharide biosynthesis regulator YciM
MVFRWVAIFILMLAVGIVYLATLNAEPVTVVLPLVGDYRPTSGLLMIASFSLGILSAIVFFAFRDWREYFRRMAESKRQRLARQAREEFYRARAFHELGYVQQAGQHLTAALERDNSLAEAHALQADILAAQGDYYAATAGHNQAQILETADDTLVWKLANDYLGAGNVAMALKVIRDRLEAGDRTVYLLTRFRDLQVTLRDWDGAIAAQNKLIRLKEYKSREGWKEMLAGLHFEKGKHLLGESRPDEAAKAMEEAIKLDPSLALAYVTAGEAYRLGGKDKSALKIWALGYRRTGSPAILSTLEEYYLRNNDPSRIINLYLRHIEEKPDDARLRFQFASLLHKLEMHQEAMNQLEEVRRISGEELPQASLLAYRIKEKLEDHQGALAELNALVEGHLENCRSYRCRECGHQTPHSLDRCPQCGRWGTVTAA